MTPAQIVITGPDGHATFQVSERQHAFEVFPNSHMVFRKNMPNWRDLIDVLLGQVRVHIQKLGTIPNPNRVITPTAVISVRGTTFDITVDDEGESTLVQVEEGLVEVQHALSADRQRKAVVRRRRAAGIQATSPAGSFDRPGSGDSARLPGVG